MVFLLPGVFWIVAVALTEFGSLESRAEMTAAYLITAALAAIMWFVTWRGTIRWTVTIIILTALLTAALMASSFSVYFIEDRATETLNLFLTITPLMTFAFWLIATAWLWRRPDALSLLSRTGVGHAQAGGAAGTVPLHDAVRCGQCAYSLRGLTEVRCPECGWTSTIDAVVHDTLVALSDD